MRILVLCHHYSPEIGAAAKRTTSFVRSWREHGADVDVVTPLPHYPSGSWDRSVPMSTLVRSEVGSAGECIHRVPFLPDSRSGATKLLDQLVVASAAGLRSVARPVDVVFATTPALPTLAPAVALANRHRVPLVLEFRDAWPDLVAESDIAPTAALQESITSLVTAAQRRADAIITTSEGFADVLRGRLEDPARPARPIVAIRNGVDIDAVPVSTPLAPFVGPLRVLYLGTLGVSQDLEVAVRALAELGAELVEARFIGDGAAKSELQKLAAELDAPIRFEDPVPAEQVWDAYDWSHTCLVPLRDWPSFAYTIPSKIFETLATGRHVTAAITGEAAGLVIASGGGMVVEPGSVSALVAALRNLIDHPSELVMGDGPRSWVAEHACRRGAADRALEVLDRAVEHHRLTDDAVGLGGRAKRSLRMAHTVGVSPILARGRSRAGRALETSGIVHSVSRNDAPRPSCPVGWPATHRALDPAGPMTGQVAEDVLKGIFSFRGERHELGDPINWSPAEPSHLWRFDLHGFEWIDAFLDHEDREWSIRASSSVIESWIAGNPIGRGDGWASFTASTRAWAWCQAHQELVREHPVGSVLADSLVEHQRYIESHLEFDLGGNHLIKNLKALIGLAVFFDDSDRLDRALDHLVGELEIQVLADGGHAERSTAYHVEVLSDLVDIAELLRTAGSAGCGRLGEYLTRMRRHLGAVTTDGGALPLIGDGWPVSPQRVRELTPVRTGARLDLRRDSGLVIARPDDRLHVVLSVGETGWDRLPGHAHSSALSMVVFDGDHPVLTDLGSSTYAPGAVRSFERSCHAHSTVSVNGLDPAEQWGSFRTARLASSRLVSAHDGDGGQVVVTAEVDWIDGRLRAQHRRSWTMSEDMVVVDDEITGRRVESVEFNFCVGHTEAEIKIKPGSDGGGATVDLPGWTLDIDAPVASRVRVVPAPGGQPASILRMHVRADLDHLNVRSVLSRTSADGGRS